MEYGKHNIGDIDGSLKKRKAWPSVAARFAGSAADVAIFGAKELGDPLQAGTDLFHSSIDGIQNVAEGFTDLVDRFGGTNIDYNPDTNTARHSALSTIGSGLGSTAAFATAIPLGAVFGTAGTVAGLGLGAAAGIGTALNDYKDDTGKEAEGLDAWKAAGLGATQVIPWAGPFGKSIIGQMGKEVTQELGYEYGMGELTGNPVTAEQMGTTAAVAGGAGGAIGAGGNLLGNRRQSTPPEQAPLQSRQEPYFNDIPQTPLNQLTGNRPAAQLGYTPEISDTMNMPDVRNGQNALTDQRFNMQQPNYPQLTDQRFNMPGQVLGDSPVSPLTAPPIMPPTTQANPELEKAKNRDFNAGTINAIDGKPYSSTKIDPYQIKIDPERFQFRAHQSEEQGTDNRLEGVDEWKNESAGEIWAWQSKEGETFVVDGHHRTAKLQDLKRRGAEGLPETLDAKLFREADGWTPESIRQKAALNNVRQGNAEPIDVALAIRGLSDEVITDEGLPKNAAMNTGRKLARLSDEALTWFIQNGENRNGEGVKNSYATAVVDMLGGTDEVAKQKHLPALRLLQDQAPDTLGEARDWISEVENSETTADGAVQVDIFGNDDAGLKQAQQRVEVKKRVKKILSKVRAAGSAAVRDADIHQTHNIGDIDVEAADQIRNEAGGRLRAFERDANLKGEPMNIALNEEIDKLGDDPKESDYQAAATNLANLFMDVDAKKKPANKPVNPVKPADKETDEPKLIDTPEAVEPERVGESEAEQKALDEIKKSKERLQSDKPQEAPGGIFDETETHQMDINDFKPFEYGNKPKTQAQKHNEHDYFKGMWDMHHMSLFAPKYWEVFELTINDLAKRVTEVGGDIGRGSALNYFISEYNHASMKDVKGMRKEVVDSFRDFGVDPKRVAKIDALIEKMGPNMPVMYYNKNRSSAATMSVHPKTGAMITINRGFANVKDIADEVVAHELAHFIHIAMMSHADRMEFAKQAKEWLRKGRGSKTNLQIALEGQTHDKKSFGMAELFASQFEKWHKAGKTEKPEIFNDTLWQKLRNYLRQIRRYLLGPTVDERMAEQNVTPFDALFDKVFGEVASFRPTANAPVKSKNGGETTIDDQIQGSLFYGGEGNPLESRGMKKSIVRLGKALGIEIVSIPTIDNKVFAQKAGKTIIAAHPAKMGKSPEAYRQQHLSRIMRAIAVVIENTRLNPQQKQKLAKALHQEGKLPVPFHEWLIGYSVNDGRIPDTMSNAVLSALPSRQARAFKDFRAEAEGNRVAGVVRMVRNLPMSAKVGLQSFLQGVDDGFLPARKLARQISPTKAESLDALINLFTTSSQAAATFLTNGFPNIKANGDYEFFNEAATFEKIFGGLSDSQVEELNTYLQAKRAWGKGEMLENPKEPSAEILKRAAMVRQFVDAGLVYSVKSGGMTALQAQQMKQEDPEHVPSPNDEYIKMDMSEQRGSPEIAMSIADTLPHYASFITRQSRQKNLLKLMTEFDEVAPVATSTVKMNVRAGSKDLTSASIMTGNSGEMYIKTLQHDKKGFLLPTWHVAKDPHLARVFMFMTNGTGANPQAIAHLTSVKRIFATSLSLMPNWMLSIGVLKEPLYAAFSDRSKSAMTMKGLPAGWAKGGKIAFKRALGKDYTDADAEIIAKGAIMVNGNLITGGGSTMTDVQAQSSRTKLGRAWDNWIAAAHSYDAGPRLAVYKMMRDQGKTQAEAASAAKEVFNFDTVGDSQVVHYMRALIPFFQPGIRGIGQFGDWGKQSIDDVKTIANKGGDAEARKGSIKRLSRRLAIITAIGIVSAISADDLEEHPLSSTISERNKAGVLHQYFKLNAHGNGLMDLNGWTEDELKKQPKSVLKDSYDLVSIPAPFSVGAFANVGVEIVKGAIRGKPNYKKMLEELKRGMGIAHESPILQGLSLLKGGSIRPQNRGKPLHAQKGETMASTKLGHATGISPDTIDATLDTFAPGLPKLILKGMDVLSGDSHTDLESVILPSVLSDNRVGSQAGDKYYENGTAQVRIDDNHLSYFGDLRVVEGLSQDEAFDKIYKEYGEDGVMGVLAGESNRDVSGAVLEISTALNHWQKKIDYENTEIKELQAIAGKLANMDFKAQEREARERGETRERSYATSSSKVKFDGLLAKIKSDGADAQETRARLKAFSNELIRNIDRTKMGLYNAFRARLQTNENVKKILEAVKSRNKG